MLMFHLDSGSDMMSDEKLMSLKLNRSFHHLMAGRGKKRKFVKMEILSRHVVLMMLRFYFLTFKHGYEILDIADR